MESSLYSSSKHSEMTGCPKCFLTTALWSCSSELENLHTCLPRALKSRAANTQRRFYFDLPTSFSYSAMDCSLGMERLDVFAVGESKWSESEYTSPLLIALGRQAHLDVRSITCLPRSPGQVVLVLHHVDPSIS